MKILPAQFEKKNSAVIVWILCSLLFIYVGVRAFVLDITWDEAYNYLHFTRKGIFIPFNPNGISANNHMLNTWLTGITVSLFGISEFTLRIPVLLSYTMFLFFTAKISNEFSSSLIKISSFLILNLNPYLLDFFSLARGYGLSYGLLAGSLWYLYLFLKNNLRSKYSLCSIVFSMLAVLSHLTLIHYLFALTFSIFLIDYCNSNTNTKFRNKLFWVIKKNTTAAVLLFIFLSSIIPLITALNKAGAFFFGGTTGFWHDTIVSIFERTLYEKNYPSLIKYILGYGSLLIIVIAIISSIKIIRSKKPDNEKFFIPVILFILLSCSFTSIIQHHLFAILYLTERTALYLLLLFTFLFVFLSNQIAAIKKVFILIFPVISIILIVHFLNCFNLKYVLEWKWDADVKEMISDLDSLKNETPHEKFTTDLGMNLEFELPVSFYRYLNHLTWLGAPDRNKKFHALSDFYLFFESDLEKINPDSFIIIKTYPLNNNKLLKRKFKPSYYEISFSKKLDFEGSADSLTSLNAVSTKYFYSVTNSGYTDKSNEYSGGINYTIASVDSAVNSMVIIKAMIRIENLKNSQASFIVSFENKKEIYSWQQINLPDFADDPQKWVPVYFSTFIPPQTKGGDVLKTYLWNKDSPVYIDDLELRWLVAVY